MVLSPLRRWLNLDTANSHSQSHATVTRFRKQASESVVQPGGSLTLSKANQLIPYGFGTGEMR